MNLDPTDIKSWLVDGTVADVKSVLAGYIYDGAQLDDSDVWDIRRTVVCDAIIEGLTGTMPLLKMASRARVKKSTYIPEYFLGVMERGLPLKLPPLCHLKAPQRTAARLAHQLDQLVSRRLGLTNLYVTEFNSVNEPEHWKLPQDGETSA